MTEEFYMFSVIYRSRNADKNLYGGDFWKKSKNLEFKFFLIRYRFLFTYQILENQKKLYQ